MKKRSRFSAPLIFLAGFILALAIGALIYYTHALQHDSYSTNSQKSTYASSSVPVSDIRTAQMQADTGVNTVPVLAVDDAQTTGLVGLLTVREIPGDSMVLVNIDPLLQTDLQYSVNQAVTDAKTYTNYKGTDDLLFSYNISSDLLGGGSAGAATAVATIATLEGKSLDPTVAISGTIDDQGNIGPVGGLSEKEKAAAAAGYKTLLIPKGQAIILQYNRTMRRAPTDLGRYAGIRSIPKSVDLIAQGKQLGINVIEVATIDEAVKHMIK